MSEKKRFALKLNLFDICILVVAVVGIAALLVWNSLSGGASEDPELKPLHYVIELEQLHEQTADKVAVGQELYDRVINHPFGIVKTTKKSPTKILSKDSIDGEFLFTEVPGRYNVIMDIEAEGYEFEDRFELKSGRHLRAGTFVYVVGPGYCASGYILSVERGES